MKSHRCASLAGHLVLALLLVLASPPVAQATVQRGSYAYRSGSGRTAFVLGGTQRTNVPLRTGSPARWTSAPTPSPSRPGLPEAAPPGGQGGAGVTITRVTVPGLPVPSRATPPVAAPAPAQALPPSPAPPAGVALSPDEQRLAALVNQARAAQGLAPLALDARLVETARRKARDMVARGYFGHDSPTYGQPWDMWRAAGVAFWLGGENLAGAPSVDLAFGNLMRSPGHRANILNPSYTHMGVGVADGGPYGKMIVQHFVALR